MTILETERLRLRQFTIGDAEFALRLLNEPSFLENIGDKGVRTVTDAVAYLLDGPIRSYAVHGHGLYCVEAKESGGSVGMCGLLKREQFDDPDIGYAFLPESWGRGLALESATAVLDYGRRVLRHPRTIAVVSPRNARSIRLLEKLGLVYSGRVLMEPDRHEVCLYVIEHAAAPDAAATS